MYFRAYQKWRFILLCDAGGEADDKGRPARRARFEDCVLMQGSSVWDKREKEIFEKDIVRLRCQGRIYEGEITEIPDMFKSRGLHPLQVFLDQHGIVDGEKDWEWEIIGNRFTNPELLFRGESDAASTN